jgi:hypothetical protein
MLRAQVNAYNKHGTTDNNVVARLDGLKSSIGPSSVSLIAKTLSAIFERIIVRPDDAVVRRIRPSHPIFYVSL